MTLYWLAPGCFAATALGLLLAALLTPGSTSLAVLIILPIIIGFCLLALRLQHLIHHRDDNQDDDSELFKVVVTDSVLRTSSVTIVVIMAPSVSFFILLLLRLTIGEDHFHGDAAMLDFGPVDGIEGGEPNISFGDDFLRAFLNSLIGGVAAICAFPAVSRILAGLAGGHFRSAIFAIVFLLSAVLTLDPSFYLIEYFIKNDKNFSTSSHMSTFFEWAVGYCLGMSIGFVTTALVQRQMLMYMDTSESNGRDERSRFDEYGYDPYDMRNSRYPSFDDDDEENPNEEKIRRIEAPQIPCRYLVRIVHFLCGLLVVFTTFASAILLGHTWNTCVGGATDCVNYSADQESANIIGSLFAILPAIIIAVAAWRVKSRDRAVECDTSVAQFN